MKQGQIYCGKLRVIDSNRKFVNLHCALLEHVMREVTGKGCRLNSLRNTGRGEDRRLDKLAGTTKAFRQYKQRYA